MQDVSPSKQISDLACAVAELHETRIGGERLLMPAWVCMYRAQPGYLGTFMHVLLQQGGIFTVLWFACPLSPEVVTQLQQRYW